MRVKVRCDICGKQFKLTTETMKNVKEIKRALGCTCMKCMSNKIDLTKVYGNTVMLVW